VGRENVAHKREVAVIDRSDFAAVA
jgi:hypothetical protein